MLLNYQILIQKALILMTKFSRKRNMNLMLTLSMFWRSGLKLLTQNLKRLKKSLHVRRMDRFLKFIKQPHPVRDEIVFGTGVIFFFIADRLLKYYAVHSRTDFFILPGVVKFALTPNKGIALGIPFPMSLTILMSVFLALILIVFFYQTHRTKKVFYRFSYV